MAAAKGDSDYSQRWRRIKAGFSLALPLGEGVNPGRKMKGERGLRQRRFWEHTIRDEGDLNNHLDYIHYNPVKHVGLAAFHVSSIRATRNVYDGLVRLQSRV